VIVVAAAAAIIVAVAAVAVAGEFPRACRAWVRPIPQRWRRWGVEAIAIAIAMMLVMVALAWW